MQKITPFLWFDTKAKEAAELYVSLFEDSRLGTMRTLLETPSGTVEIVNFVLAGQDFSTMSAGPLFQFNLSVSFLVACTSEQEVETLWSTLSQDGEVLMEKGEYPFSKKYGWTKDRYGVSWQIMLWGEDMPPAEQKIIPTLMFVGNVFGRAYEAMNFYTEIFRNATIDFVARYEKQESEDAEGMVKQGAIILEHQHFALMDGAGEHNFAFNEAISFVVRCDTQEEIDYYWNQLSAVPEAEQCGWIKDKFGVSWQIVPSDMDEILYSGTPEQIARVTEAFLKMKKFDIATLRKVAEGK